ncbi:hypothetical protein TNCV_2907881 [Trichonephila clavipes]|nr:hypothetical protein TNCV_2907881 [Trichonephila clavipes]
MACLGPDSRVWLGVWKGGGCHSSTLVTANKDEQEKAEEHHPGGRCGSSSDEDALAKISGKTCRSISRECGER